MRLGFLLIILIVNFGCKTITVSTINKTIVVPGLPNLNKYYKYEFSLNVSKPFQFKEIKIIFEDGLTETINSIDLTNSKNQKGFRLTNFNTKIEKGNYYCVLKSNILHDTKNEKIVIKTISSKNKENSYIIEINHLNFFLSK